VSVIRLRVTFDPSFTPKARWHAVVYDGDENTGVAAYAGSRDEAIREASQQWMEYQTAGGRSEEWVDLP